MEKLHNRTARSIRSLCGVSIMGAVLCAVTGARAEGLSSLIEVGESMKEIQRSYGEDTKSFNAIKTASESGKLKGMSREAVERNFGRPVIKTYDGPEKRERWVYMPGTSTFFEGPKVHVCFGGSGSVESVRSVDK